MLWAIYAYSVDFAMGGSASRVAHCRAMLVQLDVPLLFGPHPLSLERGKKSQVFSVIAPYRLIKSPAGEVSSHPVLLNVKPAVMISKLALLFHCPNSLPSLFCISSFECLISSKVNIILHSYLFLEDKDRRKHRLAKTWHALCEARIHTSRGEFYWIEPS